MLAFVNKHYQNYIQFTKAEFSSIFFSVSFAFYFCLLFVALFANIDGDDGCTVVGSSDQPYTFWC